MTDWTSIAGRLIASGAPALGATFGGAPGEAIGKTIGTLAASALGVPATPEAVEAALEKDPDAPAKLHAALAPLEAIYLREIDAIERATAVTGAWGAFKDGWRPALSWIVIATVVQSFVLAPWLTAFGYKTPTVPLDEVMLLAGLWLTIYGGGHTLKAIAGGRLSK